MCACVRLLSALSARRNAGGASTRALGWRGYLDVARSDVRIAPAVRIQEVEGPELVADTLALLLSNVLARLRQHPVVVQALSSGRAREEDENEEVAAAARQRSSNEMPLRRVFLSCCSFPCTLTHALTHAHMAQSASILSRDFIAQMSSAQLAEYAAKLGIVGVSITADLVNGYLEQYRHSTLE